MNRSIPFLTVALLAGAMLLTACDGATSFKQDAGLPEAPPEAAESISGETALVRLSSDLQVFELVGPLESLAEDTWSVAGVTFQTGEATEFKGTFAPGDTVKVEIALQADGQLVARQVEPAIAAGSIDGLGELEFIGILDSAGTTEWVVNGMTLQIGPGTELQGAMQPGVPVKVHAVIGAGGALLAREIEPAEEPEEDESEAVGEFEFVGAVEAIGDGTWTVGGRTLTILPGTELKGPIAVGDVVKVHAVPQADGSLAAREIEVAGADDLDDDSQDDSNSEAGEDFKFFGVVEAIGDGEWTIGGLTFQITGSTEFDSHILVGDMVEVELIRNPDGSLTAKEIEEDNDGPSLDDDDDSGEDHGGSDDEDDAEDDQSGSDGSDDSNDSNDNEDDNSGPGGGSDDD